MNKITNEQIDEIAESMPGGMEGFMKGWGWQQFARKLLGLQEQAILDLQVELAKVKKSRKKWRNRAIANLADAMQKAASDAVESLNKMAMSGDFVKVEAGEEKQEQAAQTLTHNGKTYPVGVWIEWGGGNKAPIPDGVKYRVRFGDGDESAWNTNASMSRWWKVGSDGDIVAFMIFDGNPESEFKESAWIDWNGGECPVGSEVIVQVKAGSESAAIAYQYPAMHFDWSKKLQYRVAK